MLLRSRKVRRAEHEAEEPWSLIERLEKGLPALDRLGFSAVAQAEELKVCLRFALADEHGLRLCPESRVRARLSQPHSQATARNGIDLSRERVVLRETA